MNAYIHACHSISIRNRSGPSILNQPDDPNERVLTEPDYKSIIPASLLRRMSKVIRMGSAAALGACKGMEVNGIIVGTGSGCFDNSILFYKEFMNHGNGALSPTSFIQSTDNTIAGQIAILLKNHEYNNTYIHKGLAFENALFDAMLLANETGGSVLVGGVDEWIRDFSLSGQWLQTHPDQWIGEGASFFMLNTNALNAMAKIEASRTVSINLSDLNSHLNTFLSQHKLPEPDLILFGNSYPSNTDLMEFFTGKAIFNYSGACGIYFTNSSFAVHLGAEIIARPALALQHGLSAGNILVVNNFFDRDLGLTYLSKP